MKPGRPGTGAIKRRYSKAEGGAYLSNGCLHYDALQERFYDHDLWYGAETALSAEVFFDRAWARRLEEAQESSTAGGSTGPLSFLIVLGAEPTSTPPLPVHGS